MRTGTRTRIGIGTGASDGTTLATRRRREFQWIDALRRDASPLDARRFPVGIGDDAAVWRPRTKRDVVLTVDAQVENVHYRAAWLRPRELGRRAAMASLSDLAAMGADPVCLLVSVVLPPDASSASFRSLQRGIVDGATEVGAEVVGGNISAGPGSIHTTAIGEVSPGRSLRRAGARVGDAIWVSGSPGLARVGRELLGGERKRARGRAPRSRAQQAARSAFRAPVARIELGKALVRGGSARAAIDLSDGLASDLAHILRESSRRGGELGATLERAALTAVPHLEAAAAAAEIDPVAASLYGGEDYELLWVAPAPGDGGKWTRLGRRLGLPLSRIGTVDRAPGLRLADDAGDVTPIDPEGGWDHGA